MRARLLASFTYANVVGTLALFIALGGVSYAAVKLPAHSVGTKQLKSDAVTSEKVRNGTLRRKDFKNGHLPHGKAGETGQDGQPGDAGPAGARGERGAPGETGERGAAGAPGSAGEAGRVGEKGEHGAPGPSGSPGAPGTPGANGATGPAGPAGSAGAMGPAGPPGLQGPTGVVSTHKLSGLIGPIGPEANVFQFLGAQATVTTTSIQRLTGSAMVPVGITGAAQSIWLDLCYQPNAGGTVTPFSGANYSIVGVTGARTAQSVSGTTAPGAGTWKVGACAQTTATLDNNDFVNGYVQVTN